MRTKGQGLDFQSLVLNRGIQLEQPISSTHIVKYLNNLFDKSIPRRKIILKTFYIYGKKLKTTDAEK